MSDELLRRFYSSWNDTLEEFDKIVGLHFVFVKEIQTIIALFDFQDFIMRIVLQDDLRKAKDNQESILKLL